MFLGYSFYITYHLTGTEIFQIFGSCFFVELQGDDVSIWSLEVTSELPPMTA